MKHSLRSCLAILAFVILVGCSGSGGGSPRAEGLSPTSRLPDERKPVLFEIPGEFQFAVPYGWKIWVPLVMETGGEVWVERETAGLEDGFVIRICPGSAPESCLSNADMPARLVKVTNVNMAGHPAKEYRYDRETVSKTRLWTEVVTVLHANEKTYGISVRIPHDELEKEYLTLHQRIRDSFRLTDP